MAKRNQQLLYLEWNLLLYANHFWFYICFKEILNAVTDDKFKKCIFLNSATKFDIR